MLLMIDNYDSFTYNIVQYLAEFGQDVVVKRNNETSIEEITAMAPQYLLVGPGPCAPQQAGVSLAAIQHFAGTIPILGVCLGHQSIGQAFGGKIVHAKQLMHGKVSPVHHADRGVFRGLPNPVICTRYHSLALDPATVPADLEVTAQTESGVIMAVRHRELAVEAVQFHPESVLTEGGYQMLANWLAFCGQAPDEGLVSRLEQEVADAVSAATRTA